MIGHNSLIAWYSILRLICLCTTFYVSAFPKILVQSEQDTSRMNADAENFKLEPGTTQTSIIHHFLPALVLHKLPYSSHDQ